MGALLSPSFYSDVVDRIVNKLINLDGSPSGDFTTEVLFLIPIVFLYALRAIPDMKVIKQLLIFNVITVTLYGCQTAIEALKQLDTEGVFEHLFINKKTKKPYVNIAKVWNKLRSKAGFPHLRMHDLRHQAAPQLINSESSLYIVQQILGHSDPSVTQRYAHLSMKSLNDASDNASAIIKSAMR